MYRHLFNIIAVLAVTMLPALISFAGEKNLEPNQKIIKELEPQDTQWLEKSEKIGMEVLFYYTHTTEVTPTNLDMAFQEWKGDKSDGRAPDKIVAAGLGVLFGNYIVKHKDCGWVVVTDSFGTDYAVRSPVGQELYPISSVWKRIDPKNGDINFFEPIWTLVAQKEMKNR